MIHPTDQQVNPGNRYIVFMESTTESESCKICEIFHLFMRWFLNALILSAAHVQKSWWKIRWIYWTGTKFYDCMQKCSRDGNKENPRKLLNIVESWPSPYREITERSNVQWTLLWVVRLYSTNLAPHTWFLFRNS